MNSFNVTAGGLTYWSLGQQTDPTILQNGLTQLSLPDYAPATRSWLMSLKAALAEMFAKPEELIRPLRNKSRNGYTVVVESKGEDENTYSRTVNASVDKEGVVSVTAGEADRFELQRLTNHFRRVLPSSSVSDTLREIVHDQLGGISLKSTGGIYFIPEKHVGKWQDVMMVVEASAVKPTTNDLTVLPLELNEMTLRDLQRSITREIESAADRLRKDIVENDLGDQALLTRATRASALRDRVKQYEGILGQTLDVCHQCLDTAVQAFSVASAVAEDSDVYEGVF